MISVTSWVRSFFLEPQFLVWGTFLLDLISSRNSARILVQDNGSQLNNYQSKTKLNVVNEKGSAVLCENHPIALPEQRKLATSKKSKTRRRAKTSRREIETEAQKGGHLCIAIKFLALIIFFWITICLPYVQSRQSRTE